MPSHEGFIGSDPHLRSLIDQVKAVSNRKYWLWTSVWAAMAIFVSALLLFFLPKGSYTPGKLMLVAAFALPIFGGFCSSIYYLCRFAFSHIRQYLLLSASFFILGTCLALKSAGDLFPSMEWAEGWSETAGWVLFALSLVYLGENKILFKRVSSFVFSSHKVSAFVFVILAVLVWRYGVVVSDSIRNGQLWNVCEAHLTIASIVVMTIILMGNRKYLQSETDRIGMTFSAFFVPAICSAFSDLFYDQMFNSWWIVSQVQMMIAWLAMLTSIVIDGAHARKEVSEQIDRMESLHQISWSLVGVSEVNELLNVLVKTLKDKLDVKIAAVYMADDDGINLELAAATGPENFDCAVGSRYRVNSEGRRPGFHTGHTSAAFKLKEVRIAQDLYVDPEFVPWRVIADDNGCAVSLPLLNQEKAIGVLNLYIDECSKLTYQRLKLMMTVAAAATLAIEKTLPNYDNNRYDDGELKLAA